MILAIDNYDSFVYNLVQAFGTHEPDIRVARNDAVTIPQIRELAPDAILISPGPGAPHDAGLSIDIIREFGAHTPILGVCLGHQAIAAAFGAIVSNAGATFHGKTSAIHHNAAGLFANMPNPFTATRYHSLHVERDSLPNCLDITAQTDDGIVMALQHKTQPTYGVQFHLESILTESGDQLVRNFLAVAHCSRNTTARNHAVPRR